MTETSRFGGPRAVPASTAEPGGGLEAVYRQAFTVSYDYPVYFTEALFDRDNPAFEQALCRPEAGKRHRVVVFVDANVAASWPGLAHAIAAYVEARAERIELVAPPETVPAGEQVKNDPALLARLQRRLGEWGIDRHSCVVGIGGGALLDLIGFAAATTHRGVRHIRVPTTVLAQNDSGVGVKNGVNAFGKKNFLGAFAPPHAVINDTAFLRTLPSRDRLCGIAEAVKVALIRDAEFFDWLEGNAAALHVGEPAPMARMIRRCAELHMRQIAQGGDPFERGSARPLDFGHWSAHRLESLTASDVRHGEAVAIGIALDTHYSVLSGMLARDAGERVHALLERLGLALWHPALEARDERGRFLLLDGIEEFREHLGGELTVTLLRAIGRGEEVNHLHPQLVLRSVAELRSRETRR